MFTVVFKAVCSLHFLCVGLLSCHVRRPNSRLNRSFLPAVDNITTIRTRRIQVYDRATATSQGAKRCTVNKTIAPNFFIVTPRTLLWRLTVDIQGPGLPSPRQIPDYAYAGKVNGMSYLSGVIIRPLSGTSSFSNDTVRFTRFLLQWRSHICHFFLAN